MRRLILLPLILAMPLSGCAAVLAGGPSRLDVAVEEPQRDVEVLIEGVSNGHRIRREVPFFEVELDRKSDYALRVRAPGYASQTHSIGRSLQPQLLGDLLLIGVGATGIGLGLARPGEQIDRLGGVPVLSLGGGLAAIGLIGLGYDVLTGAAWRHQPRELTVTLEREPARGFWPFR